MTKEEKDLLLKDLCARLPYNPLVEYEGEDYNVLGIAHCRLVLCKPFMSYTLNENPHVEKVKPYLFPLSSMTEEQKQYLKNRFCYDWDGEPYDLWKCQIEIVDTEELIDWFNKNHLDYRGLIEKNSAIDATNLNIY